MRNFYLLLCLFFTLDCHSQIVINEFMQSNIDCLMDDLNEYPDSWVELYNPQTTAVNLSQYKIGLTKDVDKAWQLPSYSLKAKGYVVIYCDKEGKGLHTDFRLESGKGGAIYLMNKSGDIVDNVTNIAKQPCPNIAYGRQNDGSTIWGYLSKPTPNAANSGKIPNKIAEEPIFSIPGNVYEKYQSLKLTLSVPESMPSDAIIRYTTNGSEPTIWSTTYTSPISITSSKVIRAKIFCNGYIPRVSTTHSYIFHSRNVTLPVISLVTDNKNIEDSKIGILVKGDNESNPNYKHDWRRPFNIEYFEGAGKESELNQLCEARVCGGASRDASLKSLALYANKRFGEKRFNYEFFPEDKPGLKDFKSIMLRNAGNDFDYLYMRDAIIQRSMAKHADIDWQAYRPAIIYINGTYRGMLNIRERSNEENVYSNHGGLEDVDVFENWNSLKEGTWDNLNAFKAFFNEHGHTWEEYNKLVDLNEFINYNIMNFYFNNTDFPGNNLVIWRPREEGGKWRFIAKDTEYGLNLYSAEKYDYPYLRWFNDNNYDTNHNWGNTYDATRLFRRLMEDSEFNRKFIDRFAIYMSDFLNYDRIWNEIWEPMYDIIKFEYPYHRKLFNEWWPNYNEELSNAKDWLRNRTNFFFYHLADYYSLGKVAQLKINNIISEEESKKVSVSINDIPLTRPVIAGKFFSDRSISIKATANDGARIAGFKIIKVSSSGKSTSETVSGDTYTTTMPGNLLQVNVILDDATTSITTPVNSISNHSIFDITGRQHNSLQKGINILRNSDGTTIKMKF